MITEKFKSDKADVTDFFTGVRYHHSIVIGETVKSGSRYVLWSISDGGGKSVENLLHGASTVPPNAKNDKLGRGTSQSSFVIFCDCCRLLTSSFFFSVLLSTSAVESQLVCLSKVNR